MKKSSQKPQQTKLNSLKILDQQDKQQFKELYQLFADFDQDGNGTISLSEWKEAMKRFGHDATEQEIEEMLKENHIELKQQLTFFEFVTLITKKRNQIKGHEHLQLAKAYRLFDKDLDGVLNPQQIKAGLERFGQTMKLDDLELLVAMGDRDGDGSINFQQFSKIMTLK